MTRLDALRATSPACADDLFAAVVALAGELGDLVELGTIDEVRASTRAPVQDAAWGAVDLHDALDGVQRGCATADYP